VRVDWDDVTSNALGNVIGASIVGLVALLVAWALKHVTNITFHEALAWALALTFGVLAVLLFVRVRRLRPSTARSGTFILTLDSGPKASVTLTHHGDDAVYRVDGKLLSLIDGGRNPAPQLFSCELHV